MGNVSVSGKGKAGGSNVGREKGLEGCVGIGRSRRMFEEGMEGGRNCQKRRVFTYEEGRE